MRNFFTALLPIVLLQGCSGIMAPKYKYITYPEIRQCTDQVWVVYDGCFEEAAEADRKCIDRNNELTLSMEYKRGYGYVQDFSYEDCDATHQCEVELDHNFKRCGGTIECTNC